MCHCEGVAFEGISENVGKLPEIVPAKAMPHKRNALAMQLWIEMTVELRSQLDLELGFVGSILIVINSNRKLLGGGVIL